MHKIKLSQIEVEILTEYVKTSPLKMVRDRAQVILMRSRDIKLEDIAYSQGKTERTVGRAIKGFAENRLGSIFSGHKNNENASKLSREQKREIKETLQQPPSKKGIPVLEYTRPKEVYKG